MFDLVKLRQKPIPDLTNVRAGLKRIKSWPIAPAECDPYDAECVSLGDYKIAGRNAYYAEDTPPYYYRIPGSIPELFSRRRVALFLAHGNILLRPHGLEFFVHDAYRPFEVQRYLVEEWVPKHIRELHPDWPEEQVMTEVERWCSVPDTNPEAPSPHFTGGAIDLTIRRTWTQEPLDMGTSFDEFVDASAIDYYEHGAQAEDPRFDEIRGNRRILYHHMRYIGFVNYPPEYWHWSYGDKAWAVRISEEENTHHNALFSLITPP